MVPAVLALEEVQVAVDDFWAERALNDCLLVVCGVRASQLGEGRCDEGGCSDETHC